MYSNLPKSRPLLSHLLLRRRIHHGPDTVEELLDRHLVKNDKKDQHDEESETRARRRLTSTRREALSLYRDIIRATRFFTWRDAKGEVWRNVLRANARKEFEEARYETDHEVVTRLLIGGREAVEMAVERAVERQKELVEKERSRGGS